MGGGEGSSAHLAVGQREEGAGSLAIQQMERRWFRLLCLVCGSNGQGTPTRRKLLHMLIIYVFLRFTHNYERIRGSTDGSPSLFLAQNYKMKCMLKLWANALIFKQRRFLYSIVWLPISLFPPDFLSLPNPKTPET